MHGANFSLRPAAAHPLTEAQRTFFRLSQLRPNAAPTVRLTRSIRGTLDVAALCRAVALLQRRHDALRLWFADCGEEGPRQTVTDAVADLECVDVRVGSDEAFERYAVQVCLADATHRWDLPGPPVRPHLLRLAPEHHVLLFTFNHAVVDAQSVSALERDLWYLYECASFAQPALPTRAATFLECVGTDIRRVTPDARERCLAYWLGKLADAPTVFQPANLPAASRPGVVAATLDENMLVRVRAAAVASRSSPFMLFTGALVEALFEVTEQDEILVSVPFTTRRARREQDVVGCFVRALPLRVRRSRQWTDLVAAVRSQTLEAIRFLDVPADELLEWRIRDAFARGLPAAWPVFANHFVGTPSGTIPAPVGIAVDEFSPRAGVSWTPEGIHAQLTENGSRATVVVSAAARLGSGLAEHVCSRIVKRLREPDKTTVRSPTKRASARGARWLRRPDKPTIKLIEIDPVVIERVVTSIPGVASASVRVTKEPTARVVADVTLEPGTSVGSVRTACRARLGVDPRFVVPEVRVVGRLRLPRDNHASARARADTVVQELMDEVRVKLPGASPDATFWEAGGRFTSLPGLAARLREGGIDVADAELMTWSLDLVARAARTRRLASVTPAPTDPHPDAESSGCDEAGERANAVRSDPPLGG